MIKIIPEQIEFRPALPVVIGNMDYQEFKSRLIRIDEILEISGIERKYIKELLEKLISLLKVNRFQKITDDLFEFEAVMNMKIF